MSPKITWKFPLSTFESISNATKLISLPHFFEAFFNLVILIHLSFGLYIKIPGEVILLKSDFQIFSIHISKFKIASTG